jgi:hypothetical protein
VAHPYTKTAAVVAPESSLAPCILDDDPAQLEALAKLMQAKAS